MESKVQDKNEWEEEEDDNFEAEADGCFSDDGEGKEKA